jgi:dinuclear metal center YbgI/SA1388 family protein
MSVSGQLLREIIEQFAPRHFAMEGDKTGLQVGSLNRPISRVLTTLDITPELVREAVDKKVDLIVSHHAVVFRPLKDLRTDNPKGQLLETLIKNDIAVYVPHTAMDITNGGINDQLAALFELQDVTFLRETGRDDEQPRGIGRIGTLKKTCSLTELADAVLDKLSAPFLRMIGQGAAQISKVALLCGDGNRFVHDAHRLGADVLITGDVYYHTALEAKSIGVALLDPGHNATERLVAPLWQKVIEEGLRERKCTAIEVLPSAVNTEPFTIHTAS